MIGRRGREGGGGGGGQQNGAGGRRRVAEIMETRRSGTVAQLRITEKKKQLRCRRLAMLKICLLMLKRATVDRRVSTLDSLRLDQLYKTGTEGVMSGESS